MKKTVIFALLLLPFLFSCSMKKKEVVVYHKFEQSIWKRFEHLNFDVPVAEVNKPYNLYFFARHSKDYEFDNLDIAVIINTPAGEERINQYSFPMRKKFGEFTGTWRQDTCEAELALKKGIFFSQKGVVKIDVECLVPRVLIGGLYGVGIRLVPGD